MRGRVWASAVGGILLGGMCLAVLAAGAEPHDAAAAALAVAPGKSAPVRHDGHRDAGRGAGGLVVAPASPRYVVRWRSLDSDGRQSASGQAAVRAGSGVALSGGGRAGLAGTMTVRTDGSGRVMVGVDAVSSAIGPAHGALHGAPVEKTRLVQTQVVSPGSETAFSSADGRLRILVTVARNPD